MQKICNSLIPSIQKRNRFNQNNGDEDKRWAFPFSTSTLMVGIKTGT